MSFYNPVGSPETLVSTLLDQHGCFPSPGSRIFFVNNSTTAKMFGAISGSDGNGGLSPKEPLATITKAISKCVVGRGDVIVVMPGHAETLTAALAMSTAGVQLLGCQVGNLQPVLTANGTINLINLTGAGCMVAGLKLVNITTDATTSLVNVAAADCTLKNLKMIGSASGSVAVTDLIVVNAGGDRCRIENVEARNTSKTNNSFINIAAAVDGLTIKSVYYRGLVTTGGIIDAAAATQIRIEDSTVAVTGSSKSALVLSNNSGGVISNCNFGGTNATLASNVNYGNATTLFRMSVNKVTDGSAQGSGVVPAVAT